MGYQLIVWEGTRPDTDEGGRRACDEIKRQYFEGGPTEPTPTIREFVSALTEVWTDNPDDPRWESSVWALPNLIDDASGPALWVVLPMDVGPIASAVVAAMAEERGLVTFDCMVNLLRPVTEEFIAEYWRHRASAFN